MAQIQIRDAQGQGIPLINVRLAIGTQSSDDAYDDRFTDLAGNTAWPNPLHSMNGYTLYVNVRNVDDDYASLTQFVPSLGVDIPLVLPRKAKTLSRLTSIDPQAHRMVSEAGEHVYGAGASAFLLYKKFLDGQDITQQLSQLQGLGCNLIRVMGMFESLGGFDPKAYGQRYYDQIQAFCALCESYGIYVLWTACAATGSIFTTDDQVIEHIRKTVAALKATNNAIFSPVNEQGQHNNSINLQRVKAEIDFGWLLHDMGSYGMDLKCESPFGTHAVLHCSRAYPARIKDGNIVDHPNHVNDNLEVGCDEPHRMGTSDDPNGNGSEQDARDAAGSAYTALFWVAHSLQGEKGDVLTGNTLDCVRGAMIAMSGH